MRGWIAAALVAVLSLGGAVGAAGCSDGSGATGTVLATTATTTTTGPATTTTTAATIKPPRPPPSATSTGTTTGASSTNEPEAGLPAAALSPVAAVLDVNAVSGGLMLKAVQSGQFEAPVWIEIEYDGLLVQVGAHALRAKVASKLLRLPVSYQDVLAISRKLGWIPPTSALSDAIWKAATLRIAPVPLGNWSTPEKAKESSQKMVRMGYCQDHNSNVDKAIPPSRAAELTSSEGKDWILSTRNLTVPRAATTYGWHQLSGKPIQGLGADSVPPAHDDGHFDQTQVLRPIKRKAKRKSDGAAVDLLDELEKRGLPAAVTKPLR